MLKEITLAFINMKSMGQGDPKLLIQNFMQSEKSEKGTKTHLLNVSSELTKSEINNASIEQFQEVMTYC